MPGLKKHMPDVRFSGNKVTPDEQDKYTRTYIIHPTASATWFGTAAAGSAGEAVAFVMLNQQADYPRTPLVTVTNSSGSICVGSAYIVGTDQFGKTLTETIALSGTQTTLKAGTGIYKTITAGTVTYGTATEEDGTATLGVAIGTTSGQVARFGLGQKLGAAGDVKMITWINNGTATGLSAGTIISTLVSTTSHSFQGTKTVAVTDTYAVEMLSSYNAENDANICS